MGGKEKMEAQGVQVCEGWEGRRRWRQRGCRCVKAPSLTLLNKLGMREYTAKLVQYVSYMSYCAVVNENKEYFSNEQMYHL